MTINLFIIDDDDEILSLFNLALSRAGFSVETANNHLTALKKIDSGYKPDVVLMDYYLPSFDGISLSKEFIKRGVKSPVFLFTAADSDVINLSESSKNIVGIIKKPFSFEDIIEKLNQTVRYHKFYFQEKEETKEDNININNELYSQKIEDIQKFLDKISHKIKNSLQTISNYVELLKKGYIEEDDKDRVFQTILDKVTQIKHELDILKRPAEFYFEESFSLKNAIRTSLSTLKKEIKDKDLYIKTSFQKNLPLYYGRKGIFIEFFSEFFRKIIDCSEKSGEIIIALKKDNSEYSVEITQSKIAPHCTDLNNYFELSFKDEKEIRFVKTFIDFKNVGSRIVIDKDNKESGFYKIVIPQSDNVSNRD